MLLETQMDDDFKSDSMLALERQREMEANQFNRGLSLAEDVGVQIRGWRAVLC